MMRLEVMSRGIQLFRAMAAGAGVEVLDIEATAISVHRGNLSARCRHQDWELVVRASFFGSNGGGQTGWDLETLTQATSRLQLDWGRESTFSFWGRPELPLLGDSELDEEYSLHATPPEAAEALRNEVFLGWLHRTSGRLQLEGGRLQLKWTGQFDAELLSEALRAARAVHAKLTAP